MTSRNRPAIRRHVVLHLFDSLDAGGAEMRTIEAIEAISDEGIQFVVGVTGRRGGALENRARVAGVTVVDLPLGRGFPLLLRQVVRQHHVTTLHTHSATASGAFMLLGWCLRVPHRIAHFRSDADQHDSSLHRRVRRTVLRGLIRVFATRVLGVSPAALAFAGAWTHRSRKAQALPSGLRTPTLPSTDRREEILTKLTSNAAGQLVVHVGRDNPVKNRPRAVEILGAASNGGVDAHLIFVGRCGVGEEKHLRSLAETHGVASRVHFVGQLRNPVELMAAADLVLVTSTREGLPGVVLEATAVGTPVLSSDLPGARWIAETLGGVTFASLEEPNEVWVSRWVHCAGSPPRNQREAALERFRTSAFSTDSAAREFASIWSPE